MHIRLRCVGILYIVHGQIQAHTPFEYYDMVVYLHPTLKCTKSEKKTQEKIGYVVVTLVAPNATHMTPNFM